MDNCVRSGQCGGNTHEYTIVMNPVGTEIVAPVILCETHAVETGTGVMFPLPDPCNCRICQS